MQATILFYLFPGAYWHSHYFKPERAQPVLPAWQVEFWGGGSVLAGKEGGFCPVCHAPRCHLPAGSWRLHDVWESEGRSLESQYDDGGQGRKSSRLRAATFWSLVYKENSGTAKHVLNFCYVLPRGHCYRMLLLECAVGMIKEIIIVTMCLLIVVSHQTGGRSYGNGVAGQSLPAQGGHHWGQSANGRATGNQCPLCVCWLTFLQDKTSQREMDELIVTYGDSSS